MMGIGGVTEGREPTPGWILSSAGPNTPEQKHHSIWPPWKQRPFGFWGPAFLRLHLKMEGSRAEDNLYLLFVNTGDRRNLSYESNGLGAVDTRMQALTNTPHGVHTLITMQSKHSTTAGMPAVAAGMCVPDHILHGVSVRVSVVFVALPHREWESVIFLSQSR